MIADHQTNTVFYADSTKHDYPKEIKVLGSIIKERAYKFLELKGTDDYYSRDYMPVQLRKNEFVQFIFRPGRYIKSSEAEFISNPVKVEMSNKLTQPRYSPLVLDGGNIIKWKDKVIITDRVLEDNRYQFNKDTDIRRQLECDLQSEVILIPEYPKEATGHADGLIKFIDGGTVFINDTKEEPEKEWLRKFLKVLSDNQLLPVELPCPMTSQQKTAVGLYINYLQVGNLIIVPQFGLKEDQKALEIIKNVFKSGYWVEPFETNWIARSGGVLNCATWGVLD